VSLSAIAGIAGAAASLFGKDKGPSVKKQLRDQQKLEENRYKWMVTGARNAGFNPSSVLGAVGGNFANQGIQQSPMQNRLQSVGEALTTVSDILDPVRQETERLNNEIMGEQLIRLRNENANPLGTSSMRQVSRTASPVKQTVSAPVNTARQAVDWFSGAGHAGSSPADFLQGQTTTFGDSLDPEVVAEDAVTLAQNEAALKNAVPGLGLPAWWPTGDMIEQIAGDDNLLTSAHGKITPWVWAHHNRRHLYEGARDVLKPYREENNRKAARKRTSIEHRSGQRGAVTDAARTDFMRRHYPTAYD